ncbi:phage repressor protein CI [Hafnia paralvei]|uniref:phage repressor protein CI n=1 Tax=Hafnia paralvei TaxID=546367 RepID=UPI0024A81764|nr:phage repressor protein CI [Hafnia paralvei]
MSNTSGTKTPFKSPSEISINPQAGGREAIERLLIAYGFKNRQALCNHLGVSQSTMANRYSRDTFPADWVIICALETKKSLYWLTTGKGPLDEQGTSEVTAVTSYILKNGILYESEHRFIDNKLVQNAANEIISITDGNIIYLIDTSITDAADGLRLIEIDEQVSVKKMTRLPKSRVLLESGSSSFECLVSDISIKGEVISRTEITN